MTDRVSYDALVVVTPKDFERLLPQSKRLFEYLPVRKLIYIGSDEVGELIKNNNLGDNVGFINENDIIPFSDVHEIIADEMKDVLKGEELPRGITGWYYQQFLKMEYSKICDDDYYMVWDGDTVPCKAFSMFADNGKPYLDLKTEFHEEYFDTLTKLFPGMFKCIEKSFIAEHMLIKKDIMLSIMADIEANDALAGTKFYEKIIHAVGANKIQDSSFSEFETYGTYVAFNCPDAYRLRDWHSFRYAGEFFDINKIDETDYEWLSRDFYALSFEKGHFVREDHKNLFDNKDYQQKLSARQMLEIAQQEFGEGSYQEIWEDDSVEKSSDNTIKGEDDVFSTPTIIVIVSYNGQYFMEKNIESIRNTVPEGTYSIVVVDNASTDGTREWLEEQEDIVLIDNNENVGFSKACNQAVNVITECGFGEYDIFLLNNDTRLCDNSLYWLKKTLHSSENIGATGAISNYAGNNQEVPVEFNTPSEYVEYGNQNNVDKEDATEDRVRLSGFAMLIRGGLWQKVGGMDEDFSPGYFEDDDLSMKISKLGYRLVLCNNSFIYHAGSQSFAKRDDVEQLLLDHYQLFVDKYGFYILDHVYPDKDVVSKLPFGINDEVNVLQAGSGLGADLKYISSVYPNSNVFGIEKDIAMFDIAKHTIPVFNSVEAMSETISGKVFNVIWIKDDISKYTQSEKEMLAAVCTDDCIVIKNKPQDAGDDTNTVVFENIKLVIWDLDQTFWDGVLSEGNIDISSKNIELIKKLTDAGIINSISSKNDEVAVNTELSKYDLDNYFVFNNINWEEKGAQIKEKLEDMHLRPENVLFIDDEIRNLKEAEYHNPGIMVATPEIIDALIAYADIIAKNDLEHKRLISYKNIESRRKAENGYSDKNQFLYDSNIKVSIETDAINEIERIYELINRTNQLNFTKVRDDIETLRSLLSDENVDKGYIRVSDKYGDYGIAGFYCMDSENNKLRHFLFSCRIMGMGIPEYVYEKIGSPDLSVVNPVATDLFKNKKVDWINSNASYENAQNDESVRNDNKIKVLLKGPCDLSSIEPYLIGGDVTTEFNFVNDQGFITTGQNHTVNIVEGDTLTREEIDSIVSDVPFIVEDDFETSLFEKEYDVIALSMLPDCHAGLYKNKKTGAYINFGSCNFDLTDPKNMRGYIDGTIVNHLYPFTEEVINKFASEWEFVGTTDPMMLLENLDYIYDNVHGTPNIVLILGSEIDYEGENEEFANHAERHREINELVRAFAEDHDRIRIIDTTDYIHSQNDFEDSINHFSRNVYYDMATKLVGYINEKVAEIKYSNTEGKIAENTTNNTLEGKTIIVFNESNDVYATLNSLSNYQVKNKIIVLDDASNNDTAGKRLNEAIAKHNIDSDLIIIDSNMIVIDGALESMIKAYEASEKIGLMGASCNSYFSQRYEANSLDEAKKLASWLSTNGEGASKLVLSVGYPAVLVPKEILNSIGSFDETFTGLDICFCDYSLRAWEKGYECRVASEAYVWDVRNVLEEYRYGDDSELLRAKWGVHYLNRIGNPHMLEDIIAPKDKPIRVLEIGCDCGTTLLEIKNRYHNAQIFGSELNPAAAKIAANVLDDVKIDNIEDYVLDFGENNFDYILFGDVLEHLRNPQGTLEYVKTLLAPDGKVVASIPNLMNFSVMEQLINGDFEYTETGLLDKTHIHLFTFNEIQKMLERAGYIVENNACVTSDTSEEDDRLIDALLSLSTKTERHMYTTFQYIVRARAIEERKKKTINEKEVSFIVCTNDEQYMEECRFYIDNLIVPEGMTVSIIEVKDAVSMASGYNRGMKFSNAKYKVYLHQDVFILNKNFIPNIIDCFEEDDALGMLGVAGTREIPKDADTWRSLDIGGCYSIGTFSGIGYRGVEPEFDPIDGLYEEVDFIDGMLMATSVDINWDEKMTGFHFYDVSQCVQFREAGYKIGVVDQKNLWTFHDFGPLNLATYEKYRRLFCDRYLQFKYDSASSIDNEETYNMCSVVACKLKGLLAKHDYNNAWKILDDVGNAIYLNQDLMNLFMIKTIDGLENEYKTFAKSINSYEKAESLINEIKWKIIRVAFGYEKANVLVESIAGKGYSLEAVVLVAIHCVPSEYYEKILKDIGIGLGRLRFLKVNDAQRVINSIVEKDLKLFPSTEGI